MTQETPGAGFFDADGTIFRRQLSWHWAEELVKAQCLSTADLDRMRVAKAAWERREQPFHAHDRMMIDLLISKVKGIPASMSVAAGKMAVSHHGAHIHTFPREVLGAFADIRCPTFAISGSPGDVVRPFAERHGMRDIRASEFVVGEDGRFTGEIREDWLSRQNKGDAVMSLAEAHDINTAESLAMGDTITDIEMMKKVGYPICYNPNRHMMAEAEKHRFPVVVERKDLWTALEWKSGGYVLCEHIESLLPSSIRKKFLLRVAKLHG